MNESMEGASMGPFGPLVMLFFATLIVVPFWRIFRKAGYSPWLAVLMVVPVVNFIMLYFLAFSQWPMLREKERARL